MKQKKKFKETKIGKILTGGFVKGLVKSTPFVGDIFGNVLDETENSPAGKVNKEEMIPNLVKIGILAVLLYLVLSGKISWEDAEQAKGFIE